MLKLAITDKTPLTSVHNNVSIGPKTNLDSTRSSSNNSKTSEVATSTFAQAGERKSSPKVLKSHSKASSYNELSDDEEYASDDSWGDCDFSLDAGSKRVRHLKYAKGDYLSIYTHATYSPKSEKEDGLYGGDGIYWANFSEKRIAQIVRDSYKPSPSTTSSPSTISSSFSASLVDTSQLVGTSELKEQPKEKEKEKEIVAPKGWTRIEGFETFKLMDPQTNEIINFSLYKDKKHPFKPGVTHHFLCHLKRELNQNSSDWFPLKSKTAEIEAGWESVSSAEEESEDESMQEAIRQSMLTASTQSSLSSSSSTS